MPASTTTHRTIDAPVTFRCKSKACRHVLQVLFAKHLTTTIFHTGQRETRAKWEAPDGTTRTGAHPPGMFCPACGDTTRYMAANRIKGTFSDAVKCDARCTGAKGHVCECSCGGANHGADHR